MTQHTDEPSVDDLNNIADAMEVCGLSWEPRVCLIGNVTAAQIVQAARALKARLSAQGQATLTREQFWDIVGDALDSRAEYYVDHANGGRIKCENVAEVANEIYKALSPTSPVEPRPQPDAAKIRKAALEEAAQLVDCGGCAGVDRLKDGTCVRATSSDCYQVLANEIRSLITADKQEGG